MKFLIALMALTVLCVARDSRDGIRYQCSRCGLVEYHAYPGLWYCSSCKTRMTYSP